MAPAGGLQSLGISIASWYDCLGPTARPFLVFELKFFRGTDKDFIVSVFALRFMVFYYIQVSKTNQFIDTQSESEKIICYAELNS